MTEPHEIIKKKHKRKVSIGKPIIKYIYNMYNYYLKTLEYAYVYFYRKKINNNFREMTFSNISDQLQPFMRTYSLTAAILHFSI